MRLRNIPGSREIIAESRFVVQEPEKNRERWHEFLGNNYPIHLEIGMGKGKFLLTLAEQYPSIQFIGIEKYSSVLIRAIEKQKELELPNLHFIRMDAANITEVFGAGEVAKIYLNFSDPWPKARYAKCRLVSRQFLERYNQFLAPAGKVAFKTDNTELFAFALEEAPAAGWEISAMTDDLHHSPYAEENRMTEYEEKFSSENKPIHWMEIRR